MHEYICFTVEQKEWIGTMLERYFSQVTNHRNHDQNQYPTFLDCSSSNFACLVKFLIKTKF